MIRRLQNKKYRDQEGRFLIEGRNLLEEALRTEQTIDMILFSEDAVPEEGSPFEALVLSRPSERYVLPRRLFEKLSDAKNGTGMIAVVRAWDRAAEDPLPAGRTGGNYVVLDRLQDPGNIGTIIRTAVAASYEAVLVLKGTADVYSPKVLRSTAGMIFHIPVIRLASEEELLRLARARGKRLAVTTPVRGAAYYEAGLRRDVALVIGNEGNGISDSLIERADIRVTIPMAGQIESLNAAVSAAILMYEAMRPEEQSKLQS